MKRKKFIMKKMLYGSSMGCFRGSLFKRSEWDFPGGPVVKNLSANAEDTGLIPGPGRFHMPQGN